MVSFWNMPAEARFKAYDALKSVDCETHDGGGSPALAVRVAKGRYGDVCQALEKVGLRQVDMYRFPLGSDTPAERFRHDAGPIPACQYLIACFLPF